MTTSIAAFLRSGALGVLLLPLPGRADAQRVTGSGAAIELPPPRGHHPVGTTTYYWIDSTRREIATSEPLDLRQIIVQLWYPAARTQDASRASYFPRLEDVRAALRTIADSVPRRVAEEHALFERVRLHALDSPPLGEPNARPRYPVVLISPGGNVSRHFHSALAQELGSHGYVAVVMSHAFSGWDVFPAGGFLKSVRWDSVLAGAPPSADDALADYLAADASHVLDRLRALAAPGDSTPFAGRLDLDRTAIVGHSRGGSTVARACATDPRFDACVTLDNIGPSREVAGGLSRPQLVIRSAGWSDARVRRLHEFLRKNRTVAADVSIRGASHMSFTDLPLINPSDGGEASPERVHEILSDLVKAFLDEHLRQQPEASVARIAAGYPEVRYESLAPRTP